MKRLILRLSILSVVLGLGVLAIAQSQFGKRFTEVTPKNDQPEAEAAVEPLTPIADASDKPAGNGANLMSNPFASGRLAERNPATSSSRFSSSESESTVVRGNDDSPYSARVISASELPDDGSRYVPAAFDSAEARPLGASTAPSAFAAHEAATGPAPIASPHEASPAPIASPPFAAQPTAEPPAAPPSRFGGQFPASSGSSRFGSSSTESPAPMPNYSPAAASPLPAAPAPLGGSSFSGSTSAGALMPGGAQRATLDRERFGTSQLTARPAAQGTGRPGDRDLEGVQTPSLTVEKAAPAEIQIGKAASFQVTVRNVGRIAAHEVLVRDEVPEGTQLIDTTPPATQDGSGHLVWQLGTIEAGAEMTVTMQVMPVAEGEIGSVATVAFQAHATTRTVCTRPRLVVEQSAPAKVLVGEMVVFALKISNPGTGAASGVILEEDVPAGLSHPGGSALEFEAGTLKPGEVRQLELALKAEKAGLIENLVVARGDANLVVESRAQVEVIAPQLAVNLAGPNLRYLERQATYSVSVANPGTAPAKEVELVARLPKGMQFVSTDNHGQYDPGTHAVYWSLEELPAQQTGTVELTTLPIETGQQKIRVEGKADMNLTDAREQTVVVEGLAALFFEVADTADPIELGKETVYEIRVVNQGSKASTNVRVAAMLPPELRPLGGEGPTNAAVSGQQVIFEPLSRLAPKADALFKLRVQGLTAGDQRVRVQVVSDDITTPVTKEESTRVYADR